MRSRRTDVSLRVSFNQESSAVGRLRAASNSKFEVSAGLPAQKQPGNIPAWALRPSSEASAGKAVRADRPIAPDRDSGTSRSSRAAPLLLVEDAAERLYVSTKTIRRLIARGQLRGTRIGRAICIQEAAVEYLIATGAMS
jgi:excisionase family DNA binding protein